MLSVPARWSELYFDIFGVLCVVGEAFVIYYETISRPPDANALDITAGIILRLAAVPIVAALQAYIIMRGRDLAMKTWETFRMERYNKGREEGIEIGTRLAIREIRERLARREASERGERDEWLDEILSELSENGSGEKRRPRN